MALVTEHLRISAFFASESATVTSADFKDLTGEEAEQTVRKAGSVLEAGPYGGVLLQVTVQAPFRADLNFQPILGDDALATGLPGVVPPGEAIAHARETIGRFLDGLSPVVRLAVGLLVAEPTQSREQSFEQVIKYLPGQKLNVKGAFDFLFQINRQKESTVVPPLLINRLGKWSGAITVIKRRDQSGSTARSPEKHSAQIEADISSQVENKVAIPKESLPALVDEMLEYAHSLVTEGEPK